MRVKIHREGTNILIILLLMLAMLNIPAWLFIRPVAIPIVFSSISAIVYLLVLNFFRSPRRHFPGNPERAVVSSVDGKVVALEETFEDEYLHRRVIQLSVFMTIFNVHANWFPVNGKVLFVRHHNGRFLSAYLPKSSTENERTTVVIRTPEGHDILVRQHFAGMGAAYERDLRHFGRAQQPFECQPGVNTAAGGGYGDDEPHVRIRWLCI